MPIWGIYEASFKAFERLRLSRAVVGWDTLVNRTSLCGWKGQGCGVATFSNNQQPNRLHEALQLYCTSLQKATREVRAKEKDHYGVTVQVGLMVLPVTGRMSATWKTICV